MFGGFLAVPPSLPKVFSFPTVPAMIARALLVSAARHVRPGGRLVYATCTVRREENQDIARDFEAHHPDFARVRPGAGWLPEVLLRDGDFQCFPHRHNTDAFFSAAWERRSYPAVEICGRPFDAEGVFARRRHLRAFEQFRLPKGR